MFPHALYSTWKYWSWHNPKSWHWRSSTAPRYALSRVCRKGPHPPLLPYYLVHCLLQPSYILLLLAGKILHQRDSLLFKLGLRQLSVKNFSFSSKSWFVYAARIAGRYDLPSLHALIDSNIRKKSYLVKSTIQKHWQETLLHDAASKAASSLRHVHVPTISKILEKVIYKRLYNFLNTSNTFVRWFICIGV